MIGLIADLSGYILIDSACLALGFLIWLGLRKIHLLAALVIIFVLTLAVSIPLFAIHFFAMPKDFMVPRAERQSALEILLYSSSKEPLKYENAFGDGTDIPSHLTNVDLLLIVSVHFMAEIAYGEDACFSVQMIPPNPQLIISAAGDERPLPQTAFCSSLATPMPGYRLPTPHIGTATAQITIAYLPEFLRQQAKPWQAQIAINSNLLREDARGLEAWRNVRTKPWMRPITLADGRTSLSDSLFSIDLASGTIAAKTLVSRPRMISEHVNTIVFRVSYLLALLFVSGGGWMLLGHLLRFFRYRRLRNGPPS